MTAYQELMEKADGRVTAKVRDAVKKIAAICEKYRYLKGSFTFNANADLENEVNRILIALSDTILDDAENYAGQAASDADEDNDNDAVLAYIRRDTNGMSPSERIDRHASRLKHQMEAWIAIEFEEGISQGAIVSDIMRYIRYPALAPKKSGTNYRANVLIYGDNTGISGFSRSAIDGMTLIEQQMINEAYQYATLQKFSKDGVERYGVMRGSTYDCPTCDEICSRTYPVTEMVLPVHPRCMCIAYPIEE